MCTHSRVISLHRHPTMGSVWKQIGSGVPPVPGSPAPPKPDPIPASARSGESSNCHSRNDAIQEMQVAIHSMAPTFPSAPRLFLGSQQRHGAGMEGWVPASPHAGLPLVTHVPAIPSDSDLRWRGPQLLLKASFHHC